MIRPKELRNKVKAIRPPAPRRAGICLHLTSLPGDYGIGELGAFAFIDQLKAMGQSLWQFLPLGPTAYGDSPYQPLSSFAGNELLIDTAKLIQLGLLTHEEARPLTRLPADRVDYGRLIPIKKALLNHAAARFATQADAKLKSAYDDFLERHHEHWLHDYALFRVLKSRHDECAWPEWDERYAKRDAAALAEIENDSQKEIEAIQIMQFLFDHQCRALKNYANENGIVLFGDVPIYIALDSADTWAHPEIVTLDKHSRPKQVAGVPPDYYSADGQLWGNPIYDWDYHAKTGYSWWIERFAHTMSLMDLVRVDHFRGFEAFWSVPYGESTAKVGRWEPGPGHAIFEALSEAFGELPIVAENLGVITPAVEEIRTQHGIPGMYILQFDASKEAFELDDIAEDSACYTGTHDNDTTLGWFNGGPGDIRSKQEVLDEQRVILEKTNGHAETIHLDLIRLAYATKARDAIVPMQDCLGLGSEARMNIPGTESNNWRWRMKKNQLTAETCDLIANSVASASRTP